MFNPEEFLSQSIDGPMATQYPVIPEGEYRAVVSSDGELKDWFSEIKWNDKRTGEERRAAAIEVPIEILDDNIRKSMGRETVLTRYRSILDMENGRLATGEGKNVKIGQLRKAVGQNDEASWSFTRLRGAGPFMARVVITSDKNDPEKKYNEVSKVTRIA